MERAMVFIDGSNLYHGLKKNGLPTQLDMNLLGKMLAGEDYRLVRVYYFNAALPQQYDPQRYQAWQSFISKVRQSPYVRVILGRLEPRGNTYVEKGVDTQIVVQMLLHAVRDNYDTAILVSGDGDFACALEAIGELGKNVVNAYFGTGRSLQLQNVSDVFREITPSMVNECLIR